MNMKHTTFRWSGLVAAVLLAVGAAGSAVAQEKITNPKVGKPLQAAVEAFKKQEWDKALAKLNEADAVANKTPYEQYAINEYKMSVLLKQRKFAEAAQLMERNLASGFVPANEVPAKLDTLVRLNFQVRNYPKVVEYGDRWMKAGGNAVDTTVLVAQSHYLQKNYNNAIDIMQKAIKDAEKSGKTVDENWLQLVRSSQEKIGDQAGAARTLESLLRLYPKPEYWSYLLASQLNQKNSDLVTINLLRLGLKVGTLDKPEEYLELTEMLLEAALPGEAKSVMEAGYQAKVFDTADKTKADRYARRLNDAKAAAAKDEKSLPTFERDAQKAPTGQGDVALGLVYFSFGQYDKAAAALSKGLQKGGVRDPDDANMTLGIVGLQLGKKADAIKAFDQVKADPKMADVARLWKIYAKSGAG